MNIYVWIKSICFVFLILFWLKQMVLFVSFQILFYFKIKMVRHITRHHPIKHGFIYKQRWARHKYLKKYCKNANIWVYISLWKLYIAVFSNWIAIKSIKVLKSFWRHNYFLYIVKNYCPPLLASLYWKYMCL